MPHLADNADHLRVVVRSSESEPDSRSDRIGAGPELLRGAAGNQRDLPGPGGIGRIEEPALEERNGDRLLALDEALRQLEAEDPRKAELVKLRFFAGLTAEQAAAVLGVSLSTAEKDWA